MRGILAATAACLAIRPETVKTRLHRARLQLQETLGPHLLGLCRDVNRWYVANRVLGQEPELTAARLALVAGVKTVLGNGLRLLGVGAPEQM